MLPRGLLVLKREGRVEIDRTQVTKKTNKNIRTESFAFFPQEAQTNREEKDNKDTDIDVVVDGHVQEENGLGPVLTVMPMSVAPANAGGRHRPSGEDIGGGDGLDESRRLSRLARRSGSVTAGSMCVSHRRAGAIISIAILIGFALLPFIGTSTLRRGNSCRCTTMSSTVGLCRSRDIRRRNRVLRLLQNELIDGRNGGSHLFHRGLHDLEFRVVGLI